jgi:hypothetical protein
MRILRDLECVFLISAELIGNPYIDLSNKKIRKYYYSLAEGSLAEWSFYLW